MKAVTCIPTVAYRWTAHLPGRGWTGTVEMPACDGAWEPVTRALLEHLRLTYGLTKRDVPVFVWRRTK